MENCSHAKIVGNSSVGYCQSCGQKFFVYAENQTKPDREEKLLDLLQKFYDKFKRHCDSGGYVEYQSEEYVKFLKEVEENLATPDRHMGSM